MLAAAARGGMPAACLVAIQGAVDPDEVAARLGRAALPAIAPRACLTWLAGGVRLAGAAGRWRLWRRGAPTCAARRTPG